MATKRLLSEDRDPGIDSGFDSAKESTSSGGNSPPESKLSRLQDNLEPALLLRTSARVQRMKEGHRDRKESEHSEIGDEDTANHADSEAVNGDLEPDLNSKQKRAWEQWSSEDKAIFFESLEECGKNFDAIRVFFHNRNKKKSSILNKNKEQIRTFYYRTWHKICKYVDFSEYKHLKKSSRELYGLINFGELRKRLGSQLDDKTGVKLRELIFKGSTTVKIKGKSHRLKTPTCAALRRLSETMKLEESSSSNVPLKISLILTPMTTDDFDKVHRLALTNPHVCLTIRPGRSLNSVFEHLKLRWKKIHSIDQELHLMAKDCCSVNVPKITVMGPTTSASLSLSNLKLKDLSTVSTCCAETNGTDIKNAESNAESFTENGEVTDHEKKIVNNVEHSEKESNSFPEIFGSTLKNEVESPNTETMSVELGNQPQGWTQESSKDISVGEIFLMTHGNNAKQKTNLELQYTWKLSSNQSPKAQKNSAFSFLSKLALSELNKKLPNSNSKIVKNLSFETNNGTNSNGTSHEIANADSEETEFKRPTLPPLSKPTIQQHQAFRQQLVNLMPKYNMRKGRPISRPKRPSSTSSSSNARPLQPSNVKPTADGQVKVRLMPAHGITFTHPVISIQSPAVSQDKSAIIIPPSTPSGGGIPDHIQPSNPNPTSNFSCVSNNKTPTPSSSNIICNNGGAEIEVHNDNSNDSLTAALSFFDTSRSADRFLDSVLENSNSSVLQTPPRVRPTPPTSPSRAVSNDFWGPDLSSLFNRSAASSSSNHSSSSTSTPNKSGLDHNKVLNLNEDSVQSNGSEVDRQLMSMMSENSVDFTSKFAKLASAVVGNNIEEN